MDMQQLQIQYAILYQQFQVSVLGKDDIFWKISRALNLGLQAGTLTTRETTEVTACINQQISKEDVMAFIPFMSIARRSLTKSFITVQNIQDPRLVMVVTN